MRRVLPHGSETLATNQVSIAATSTLIAAANTKRRALLIVNHGTTDVYIGSATVTTSDGILLTGTKGASLSIPGTMAIYGIVASGSQAISYIEVSQL